MVAAGCRDNACFALLRIEQAHLVAGASKFKGSGVLQVFALQIYSAACHLRQYRAVCQRRNGHLWAYRVMCFLDAREQLVHVPSSDLSKQNGMSCRREPTPAATETGR